MGILFGTKMILSNFNNILVSNPIMSDIRSRSNLILTNFNFISTDSKKRILKKKL